MKSKLINCFENLGLFVEIDKNFLLEDDINDSLTFISLIVEIESEFNVEIEDKYLDFSRLNNFEDLLLLINKSTQEKSAI
jgi:acyl carrier protein